MIEHAWTVVCDRTRTDRDTGSITLDAIDQLGFDGRLRDDVYVVPYAIEIVSLWFRAEPNGPESARVNINFRGPRGENVAQFPIELAFAHSRRVRTRHMLRNLMIVGAGVYHFVIELMQGGQLNEVAKVPFEIVRVATEQPTAPVQ
jgi:hypothetical protein